MDPEEMQRHQENQEFAKKNHHEQMNLLHLHIQIYQPLVTEWNNLRTICFRSLFLCQLEYAMNKNLYKNERYTQFLKINNNFNLYLKYIHIWFIQTCINILGVRHFGRIILTYPQGSASTVVTAYLRQQMVWLHIIF